MHAPLPPDRRAIDLAHLPDFALGSALVRPALRQVQLGNAAHTVEPRVMQVLVALAQAQGAPLSRDDLIARCWEGAFVTDDAITRAIGKLRRVAELLGPTGFRVETVARVGYRLVQAPEATNDGTTRPDPGASGETDEPPVGGPASRVGTTAASRSLLVGLFAATLLATIAAFLFVRSQSSAESGAAPQVRMAGFRTVSADISPLTAAAFQEELAASLGTDNLITLVTTDAGKSAPELALGGTVRRTGDLLQFTLHLRNERSGASLWSQSFEQPASFALAPKQVAASASLVLRCGLSGAGAQLASLSGRQLSLWLRYCEEVWGGGPWMPGRIIDAARRVTQAAPRFSPGWSALAFYGMEFEGLGPTQEVADLRSEALRAAAEALRLDPGNSEAFAAQALARLDGRDWREMEALMQRAIAVGQTHCACEYAVYGGMLMVVGRIEEGVAHYRRYHDRVPLGYSSSGHLADALFMAGRNEEAERVLDQALSLYPMRDDLLTLRLRRAFWTQQYQDGLAVLRNPYFESSPAQRAALTAAFEALLSGDPALRGRAAEMLGTLAKDPRRNTHTVTIALAAIGETGAAIASAGGNRSWMSGTLFSPGFAAVRRHAAFPALVERLGVARYWRETRRRPDFCGAADAPSFCRTL